MCVSMAHKIGMIFYGIILHFFYLYLILCIENEQIIY